jgi:hypothetical protein
MADRGIGLLLALSLLSCSRDHPYAPYVIGATQAPSAPSAADAAAVLDAFLHEPASTGADGGVRVQAPAGETITLVLAGDLDGDGTRDVAAWATGSDPLGGRLLFYRGRTPDATEPPRALAVLAAPAIGVTGCAAEPRLERIGPQTVSVTVRAACPFSLDASVKSLWVAVAAPAREPPLREELRVGGVAPGEVLRVELDASDRDGDGRDDLSVAFTLEGAPAPFDAGPAVAASLRYYDRPAGLSRDQKEPEASLGDAAASWSKRAVKKKEAPSAAGAARSIERLHAMLCADEGVSIVSLGSGPVRCGPSRALEDAEAVRVRAALATGDVPRALFALARAGWRPATSGRRTEILRWITRAAPPRTVAARTLEAVPDLDQKGVPGWGPLAFSPGGDLLVRTAAGIVSVALPSGTETRTEEPAWPTAVTSPDGAQRWTALYDACDGGPLRARLGEREVLVPVLAPAPGRCAPGGVRPNVDAVPLGWGTSLEAWMAGEPVTVETGAPQARALASDALFTQPMHVGSARSPDGSAIAIGTPFGALVRARSAWQLWRPGDRDGGAAYAGLGACTASNEARSVACVRDGRAVVLAGSP